MTLEHGGFLWLLLIIPCYLPVAVISHYRASDWLQRFAHRRRGLVPQAVATLLLCLAFAALVFALAGPGLRYQRVVFNRSGIDVAIGIDVSKSMLAEDEALPEEGKKLFSTPNRLNRARYSALTIMSALRGERVAVFMFASKGVAVVPLTSDYGYCRYILRHVNDAAITIPGSDLSQAIATGASLLEGGSRTKVKALILISDGEDISDDRSQLYESARRAAGQGIAIYTIGVGMGQGVLIPIRDASGTSIEGYFQDQDGAYLKTRLEEDTLQGIAGISGGSFVRAGDQRSADGTLDALLKRAKTIEYTRATEPARFPLAPLLLCAALLFFVLGIITGR